MANTHSSLDIRRSEARTRSVRAILVAVAVAILALASAGAVGCDGGKASARAGDGGSSGGDGGGTGVDGGGGPGQTTSIEVARVLYGKDYTVCNSAPQGGTLFSVWTKIPDPGSTYPWSRGNMDVYVLSGDNWYVRFLVGNSSANSPTDARLNANSMLFVNPGDVYIDDYSFYESGYGHPEAPYRDWVWAAWQLVVGPSSMTIRQWLKLGPNGAVFEAGQSTVAFDTVRTVLMNNGWSASQAAAWTPTDATKFWVGRDHGYLNRAHMTARSTTPSLSELDAIARHTAPDTAAWADYPFDWENGHANLEDVSGHGHHLSVEATGMVYEGLPGPSL